MTASAVLLGLLGLAGTFIPHELLDALQFSTTAGMPIVVQLAGALYVGFAALNWSTRSNLIGGIYGRPVVLANLMHFLIGGLALLRATLGGGLPPGMTLLTVLYLVIAAGFGWLMMHGPKPKQ